MLIPCFSDRRALVWLIVSSLLTWAWAIHFHLSYPILILDDAYIYLHMASNILDVGTAQFYPLVDNPSLIASSPLRLLILVPATWLARWFTAVDLSLETARLTLIFSGLLTSLLFLPWFWKRWQWWLFGMIFNAFASISILSLWQMEGALLFWVVFTLAIRWLNEPLSDSLLRASGYLSALLMLSRPEYGITAIFLFTLFILGVPKRGQRLLTYTLPLLTVGLSWVLIATFLEVWFVPTTYLTKVITGELDLFGADFHVVFPYMLNHYFFGNFFTSHDQALWVYAGFAFYLVLLAWQHVFYRFFVLGLVLLFALLYHSAGNYLWYFENYFIIFIGVSFISVLQALIQQKQHDFLTGFSVIMLIFFTFNSIYLRYEHPDDIYIKKTNSYRYIAKHHIGNGLFQFDNVPLTYLRLVEIGTVSYYSGRDVWLYDAGGLAQAGTLKGTKTSKLAHFYPSSLIVHADQEYQQRCQTTPQTCRSYAAWAINTPDGIDKMDIYFPDGELGLMAMPNPFLER